MSQLLGKKPKTKKAKASIAKDQEWDVIDQLRGKRNH